MLECVDDVDPELWNSGELEVRWCLIDVGSHELQLPLPEYEALAHGRHDRRGSARGCAVLHSVAPHLDSPTFQLRLSSAECCDGTFLKHHDHSNASSCV